MIKAGDTLENPVTGERLTFVKTSRETGGAFVVVEATVAPSWLGWAALVLGVALFIPFVAVFALLRVRHLDRRRECRPPRGAGSK